MIANKDILPKRASFADGRARGDMNPVPDASARAYARAFVNDRGGVYRHQVNPGVEVFGYRHARSGTWRLEEPRIAALLAHRFRARTRLAAYG